MLKRTCISQVWLNTALVAFGLLIGWQPASLFFCPAAIAAEPAGKYPPGLHLLQSPPTAATNRAATDYGLGDGHASKLLPLSPGRTRHAHAI